LPITDGIMFAASALWVSDEPAARASYGSVAAWDVSQLTKAEQLFCAHPDCDGVRQTAANATATFNDDLSAWDMARVTVTSEMFRGAAAFNSDLNGWDVSAGPPTRLEPEQTRRLPRTGSQNPPPRLYSQ
jgi:hypothetical protein